MTTPSRAAQRFRGVIAYMGAMNLIIHTGPAYAQLEKAQAAADTLKAWLWCIIPVLGLIAGGIVGLLYSFDVIRKETAYQWATGMVFAGAIAGGIIRLVF